jgi:hypothetical protein
MNPNKDLGHGRAVKERLQTSEIELRERHR